MQSQSIISIERLCKKLRPIFGNKIDRIYLRYSVSDSQEERRKIEQVLNALYEKHLNTTLLQESILLEPPSKDVIKGEYELGTIMYADKEYYPFGLREKEWVRHVCISGMSGSGKTNFAFKILDNFIKRKKPFIVLDWKKSFRPLLKEHDNVLLFSVGNNKVSNFFKININKPPKNVEPKVWVNFLADLINESFTTSHGVHKILVETLNKAFRDFKVYEGSNNYPTWYQILDRLENMYIDMQNKKNRETEWIISALRIAHALTFGAFGEAINYKGSDAMSVEDLLDKNIIFELDTLSNIEKKFFCEFLLTYVYKYMKTNITELNTGFNNAILIDEAHNVFLKDKTTFVNESITDMVYREVREYGISLICLDQHISKLSETVPGNSACNVAFQQILPRDVDVVSNLMQLKEDRKFFSMLPVGYAIVSLVERYHNPFMIKVPLMELRISNLNDDYIKEKMTNYLIKAGKKSLLEKEAKEEINEDKIIEASGVRTRPVVQGLRNHIQYNIYEDALNLLADKDVKTVKEHFKRQGYNLSDINQGVKAALKSGPVEKKKDYTLNDEESKFLKFLLKHNECSTTKAYSLQRLSSRKGNLIKNRLVNLGLINIVEERSDKGWNKKLRLSDDGKALAETR